MLETKFKLAFLFVVIAFAALPIMGILRGTVLTPYEQPAPVEDMPSTSESEATATTNSRAPMMPEVCDSRWWIVTRLATSRFG